MKSYLITCKGCETRLAGTQAHLNEHNVPHTVFRGVNGVVAGLRTVYPYLGDDPSGETFISAGRVALNLNHWFVWSEASRLGYPEVMVMEDDIRVVQGFNEYLNARIQELNELDQEWNFIYVGHLEGSDQAEHKGNCYEWKKGSIAKCSSDPYGTHCYIARASAYRILLDTQEKIFTGTDINIWMSGIPNLRHYAFIPPLADQLREGIYTNSTVRS